jgi:hypothetical protein
VECPKARPAPGLFFFWCFYPSPLSSALLNVYWTQALRLTPRHFAEARSKPPINDRNRGSKAEAARAGT